MAKVKLLVLVRDENGKQLRVTPVMNRNTPKVNGEGYWTSFRGSRRVFKTGSFVCGIGPSRGPTEFTKL